MRLKDKSNEIILQKQVLFHKEKRTTPQKREAVILCVEIIQE